MISVIRNMLMTTLLALAATAAFSDDAPTEEEKADISTNPSNKALLDEAKDLVTSDDQGKDIARTVALGHTYFGPCVRAAKSRDEVKSCVQKRHEMLTNKMKMRKANQ